MRLKLSGYAPVEHRTTLGVVVFLDTLKQQTGDHQQHETKRERQY